MKITPQQVELAEAMKPVIETVKRLWPEADPNIVLMGAHVGALLLGGATAQNLRDVVDALAEQYRQDPPSFEGSA